MNGTTYYYAAFAYDDSENYSSGVTAGPATPADSTPPGPVSSFIATPGENQVVLAWTNPADGDLAGVKIQRKVGSAPTSKDDGTEVFKGAGTGYTDTTAVNGTTYYYAAFAYDDSENYSAGVTAGPATPTVASAIAEVLNSFGTLHAELVGPDPLPDPERLALEAALAGAESLYRQGMGCEAGALLASDFLSKAQESRAGADIPIAERLYNMGRMLRFDILGSILLKAECEGAARIGLPADAEANNPANDASQIISSAVFGEPRTATVKNPDTGEVFTQLHLPEAETDMGEPGEPAIPVIRRLVAIPLDATFELVTKEPVAAETIACNLVPAQPQPVDDKPPDEVFGNLPFEKNEDLYQSDALYPSEIVRANEIGEGRDVRFLLLEIAGGQYNPKSDTLTLFKEVPVEVRFSRGKYFGTEQGDSPFERSTGIYSNALLNSVLFTKIEYLKPWPGIFELYGEELLILTHPTFSAAAEKLAAWKREKGITTRIFECGTGSGVIGRQTRDEIDTFIHNHYSSTWIRPAYILLFGDAEHISPFYMNNIGTDWPYAVLGNPAVDSVPDFAVGRIPVDTIDQANVVVDKIIAYEKNPPTSANFYKKAAIASQFQCCRTDVSWSGTDQRTFIEVSEFARNVMAGNGKTVDRIYTRTGPSTTPARYYDGTFLPSALGSGSGFAWDGDTADITAAFNEGRFLIIHRDHGWEDGWSHPDFESAHVNAVTNGDLTPVIFSVNCASGYFDNETAPGGSAAGVYFVEYALRKAGGGAVGVLGDTRNSPSWPNTALMKGFIDAMWPSAIGSFGGSSSKRRLGDMLNHGKLFMWSQIGVASAGVAASSARDELYLWHCFGDPTLEIWLNAPLRVLPAWLLSVEILKQAVLVGYETNGAVITAYQDDPRIPGLQRIIGRGEVKDGLAELKIVQDPLDGYPINYAANLEGAVSEAPSLGR